MLLKRIAAWMSESVVSFLCYIFSFVFMLFDIKMPVVAKLI